MCGDVVVHEHLMGQGSRVKATAVTHSSCCVCGRAGLLCKCIRAERKRLTDNDKDVRGRWGGPERASFTERGTWIGVYMDFALSEDWFAWKSKRWCFLLINYNNLLHLYSAFLDTQSALHCQGVSPHPPPVCSIHLDDATAAIVRQNVHHTPAYWWRGDRVMQAFSRYGDC